jgi:hypothetical protein
MAQPRFPPEVAGERKAIRTGHFDIHKNQVRPECSGPVHGRNGFRLDLDVEIAGFFEQNSKKLTDGRLVVDAKDSGF